MNLLIKEIAQKKSVDYRRQPCGHKKGAAVNNPQKIGLWNLKLRLVVVATTESLLYCLVVVILDKFFTVGIKLLF